MDLFSFGIYLRIRHKEEVLDLVANVTRIARDLITDVRPIVIAMIPFVLGDSMIEMQPAIGRYSLVTMSTFLATGTLS